MPPGSPFPDNAPHVSTIAKDYEMRFHAMEQNVCMGMFLSTYGENSRIISVNPSFASMLGYASPDEIVGLFLRAIIFNAGDLDSINADLLRDGSVRGYRLCMKKKDGMEIWVSVQAWVVMAPSTLEIVIEGFADDITELIFFEKEMQYHETELNRYALALTQANKKLNILSSITRHDILNKLTGLQGYVELMRMDFPDPQIQEYLAIQNNLLTAITQCAHFTKDYQELGVNAPRWFDVKATFESAAAMLPLEGIPITIGAENLWVYADPMLEKVFYNLIENSLRHAGNFTRITVTAEAEGEDCARIIYTDNGEGVPEEFKEAIFLRKHFKHTGFGLHLSREILDITGLSIRETGTPGRGVRFEISIPGNFFHVGNGPQ